VLPTPHLTHVFKWKKEKLQMFTFITRRPMAWMVGVSLIVLTFALTACGGSSSGSTSTSSGSSSASTSSNPSTATVYLDEKEGLSNGKDTPALDKFWWANSKTDQTFTMSYSTSIAPGGIITVNNQGDDGQKITISGPSNYSNIVNVAGDATTTITIPSTVGSYTFISDPTTTPVRPGARGGTLTVG
jgi:hypothetical protein